MKKGGKNICSDFGNRLKTWSCFNLIIMRRRDHLRFKDQKNHDKMLMVAKGAQ